MPLAAAAHLMGDGSWRLHGLALKLGSIMPDVLLYTYVSGHKYDTTAEKVAGNLAELKRAGSWTVRDCFRLGYNLHFLEDYFTYPHNSHFEGGFIAHCLYEHRLSRALQRYLHENPRPAATVLPLRMPFAPCWRSTTAPICAPLLPRKTMRLTSFPAPNWWAGKCLPPSAARPLRPGHWPSCSASALHKLLWRSCPKRTGALFSPCEKIRPSDSYSG